MTASFSRAELLELLAQPNPHAIVAAADAARVERHGRRVTFVANAQLDLAAQKHAWCPVSGEPAPPEGFANQSSSISASATQVLILPSADAKVAEFERATAVAAQLTAASGGAPTVQIATAGEWSDAHPAEALPAALTAARRCGVVAVSDGVRPAMHPAFGDAEAVRWAKFWRAAAGAGLRGQASVLYGPEFVLDAVFAQIDAIAALQEECGVFDAVAPVVHLPEGFQGAKDALSTQASQDLRVLAACRLGIPGVEHLRLFFDRTDLKSAHTSLLCGVDDLEGHLFLGERDKRMDAESKDLSLAEMSRWLEEVGFEAHLRDSVYHSRPVPMQSSAASP